MPTVAALVPQHRQTRINNDDPKVEAA